MVSGVSLCHIYICSRYTQTLILVKHSLVISCDDRMSVVNVTLNYQTPSLVSCVNMKNQSQKCQTTLRLSVNFSRCKSPLRTLNLLVLYVESQKERTLGISTQLHNIASNFNEGLVTFSKNTHSLNCFLMHH